MVKTKLRQLLDYIENSTGGISIQGIAQKLDISVNQVENMLEYWVQKGRLQVIEPSSQCGSCDSGGNCPFTPDFPRIFRIADDDLLDISDFTPCQ